MKTKATKRKTTFSFNGTLVQVERHKQADGTLSKPVWKAAHIRGSGLIWQYVAWTLRKRTRAPEGFKDSLRKAAAALADENR